MTTPNPPAATSADAAGPEALDVARRWSSTLAKLMRSQNLTDHDTAWIMGEVIRGEATQARLAAFLTALRVKGETPTEIHGMVRTLFDHATRITVPGTIVDIVGTGGAGGLNISTMATIVVASTGTRVVKHGGRAASSACGSADLLERLGIPLDLTPRQVAWIAIEAGVTFCFAPVFHPGLRHASATRRELGVPTVFNLLAPLINPADPRHQLVGSSNLQVAPVLADVLASRGCSSLVVCGRDGLDELTTATTSEVWVVRDDSVTHTSLDPRDLNIALADPQALRGGDVEHNVRALRDFLAGRTGPVRDAVILNAAAALVATERGSEALHDALLKAMARCEETVDSGAANATLERWIEVARQAVAY